MLPTIPHSYGLLQLDISAFVMFSFNFVCVKSCTSIVPILYILFMCLCEVQHLHWFPPSLCCLFVYVFVRSPAPPLVSHPLYVVYLFTCLCEVQHLHWFPTLYMLFICLCVCVNSSTSIGFPPSICCLREVQHLHWFPTLYMLFICLCVCVKSSTSIGFLPSICCLCVCVKSSISIGFPPSICCLFVYVFV